MAGTRRHDIVS